MGYNWKNRADTMCCKTCIWSAPKSIDLLRCRRHAPTMNGYPVIYTTDWCGDHKLDEGKLGEPRKPKGYKMRPYKDMFRQHLRLMDHVRTYGMSRTDLQGHITKIRADLVEIIKDMDPELAPDGPREEKRFGTHQQMIDAPDNILCGDMTCRECRPKGERDF